MITDTLSLMSFLVCHTKLHSKKDAIIHRDKDFLSLQFDPPIVIDKNKTGQYAVQTDHHTHTKS